jgi:hypothetical protein
MAGPLYYDRVKETTTTTGTGTLTLAGAVVGFQAFSVVGNGNTCYYGITDGTNWEVGLGTYTLAGTLLARTTVLASSNAGAAVSWAAGTKSVWLDLPATAILSKVNNLSDVASAATAFGNIKQAATTSATGVVQKGVDVRELLTGARTYYVRTDGNDSNTGLVNSAGGAFLTLPKAVNVVYGTLDFGAQAVTIQVGAGTYTAGISIVAPHTGGGTLSFVGDNTTPSNVLISVTNNYGITVNAPELIYVKGLKLATTTAGHCLSAQGGATISINGNMDFGASAWSHMECGADSAIKCNYGSGSYTISGSAGFSHMHAGGSGAFISVQLQTITLSGTPNFGTAFAQGNSQGQVEGNANTFSGAATGKRFDASNGGFVNSGSAGANYFPGNASGTGTNFGTSPYGLYV